jgi:hypothetical protein
MRILKGVVNKFRISIRIHILMEEMSHDNLCASLANEKFSEKVLE